MLLVVDGSAIVTYRPDIALSAFALSKLRVTCY